MSLTAENVNLVYERCATEYDPDNIFIHANGIENNARFSHDILETYRESILDMLAELPDEFHAGFGNGWTFLNMILDRNGDQWTDFHATCDRLLCLGLAIGAVEYTIKQRDLWRMFPGGMPYITIKNAR